MNPMVDLVARGDAPDSVALRPGTCRARLNRFARCLVAIVGTACLSLSVQAQQPTAFAAPGRIEGASPTVRMGFPIMGIVRDILVKSGARVTKGTILMSLICDDRAANISAAEADVADANAVQPASSAARIDTLQGTDTGGHASLAPCEPVDEDFEPHSAVASIAQPSATDPAEGVVLGKWWLPQGDRAAVSSASESDAPKKASADLRDRSLSDRRASLEWPGSTQVHQPEFMRTGAPRAERSRTERWALAILSIVAALGLAAQAAYVWRNEVAARWPAAKPWLVAACAPLHCVVDYPVHIDAITIESTALQSSTPNSHLYTLTALLRNRDTVAVRYPHLQLTLTDTQDRPILRRALRPEDYLGPSRDADGGAQGGFSAESELPIRMMYNTAVPPGRNRSRMVAK